MKMPGRIAIVLANACSVLGLVHLPGRAVPSCDQMTSLFHCICRSNVDPGAAWNKLSRWYVGCVGVLHPWVPLAALASPRRRMNRSINKFSLRPVNSIIWPLLCPWTILIVLPLLAYYWLIVFDFVNDFVASPWPWTPSTSQAICTFSKGISGTLGRLACDNATDQAQQLLVEKCR